MNGKPDKTFENITWSSFVTPCVSLSFLLSIGPAYGNRADRLAGLDIDRSALRQLRLENRAERLQNRAERLENRVRSNPSITIPQPILPITAPQDNLAPMIRVRGGGHVNRDANITRRNESKTWQITETGKVRNVNAAVELNFGSNERSIQLGQELFGSADSVTLSVGNGEKTFSAGSRVTAAEYASIIQVLGGDGQTLQLDNSGRAAGGQLSLDSLTNGSSMNVSGLVIPEAIKVVGNFSNRSDFNLKGDLVNNGAIYALSNKPGADKASIAVRNLTNNAGGLISSVTDSSMFPEYDNLQSSVDLKLRADDSLVNKGEISSSGNLTLSAKTVSNLSGNHSVASISAARDVSIETATLTNSGTISAQNNIGITAGAYDAAGSIVVNNAGGSIQALNGAITVGDINNTAKANTTLTGGDWLSKDLNLYSGDGALNVNVGELTGAITGRAGTASVLADTENLIVNSMQASGDPTFKSTGNFTLMNDITTGGGPVAILARGDINFDLDATIDTHNDSGAGGTITLVAGSNWTSAGANNSISGGSAGGGSINGSTLLLDFVSDGSTNGGDVTIVAFAGSSANSGNINLDSAAISALGGAGGNNGNVTIIGGGGVTVADVDTQGVGTNDGTGNVLISSFQPVVVNGPVLINDTTGAIVQGSFAPGTTTPNAQDVNVTGTVFAGANALVQSAASASVSDVDADGTITITAQADLELAGSYVTTGGGVTIVAGRNISGGAPTQTDIDTSSASGDGGNVFVIAGANFTQDANNITITGASAIGGFIFLDNLGPGVGNSLGNVDTSSSAVNGSGGDVTFIAYGGSNTGGGYVVTDPEDTVITTGGSGSGSNGDISIIAGQNNANYGLGVRGVFDTTGGNSVGTGNFYAATAQPLGNVVISKNTQSITSGTFRGGAITNGNAFIDQITVGEGASATILYGGFGDLAQDITAPGGILVVAGGDIYSPNFGTVFSAESAIGNGGNITMIAGATFTQSGNNITITGAGTIGGDVNLARDGFNEVRTNSNAANGSAGDITLVAFDAAGNDSGNIYIQNNATVNASGNGTGANGNIILVAGSDTPSVPLPSGIVADINFSLTGAAGTGLISFNNSTPNTGVVLSTATAGVTSGDFRGGALAPSDILVQNLTVRGGDVELISGGAVRALNVNVSALAVGDGGSVTVRTGSNETLDIGAATGSNYITSILASAGTTSGNGGTIDIQADGTGGLNVAAIGSVSATEGNGGNLRLVALTGDLVIANTVVLSANAGTATAASHNGGIVELYGRNLTSSGFDVSASSTGGGTGGVAEIVVTGGGNLSVGTGANDVTLVGNFSLVRLGTIGGGDVTVTSTGALTTSSLIDIDAETGDVSLQGALSAPTVTIAGQTITSSVTISGSTALTIDAAASFTNTGLTTGGAVSINGGNITVAGVTGTTSVDIDGGTTGSVLLQGAVNSPVTTVAGQIVTNNSTLTGSSTLGINTPTFITTGATNGGVVTINSSDVTVTNTGSITATVSLDIDAGATGDALLQGAVSGPVTSITGQTVSNSATLSGSTSLTIEAESYTASANATGGIISISGGDVTVNSGAVVNGSTSIDIDAGATGDVVNSGTITSPSTSIVAQSVTNSGTITGTTLLDIDTASYINSGNTNGGVINLHSLAGGSLALSGVGGTFTSTVETQIGSDVNISLSGSQTFNGNVDLTAISTPTSSITLQAGSTYIGNNQVRITTYTYTELPVSSFIGNPKIVNTNFYNIINTNGDVVLPANLIFTGQSLAIIASGNITSTGATLIDLSAAGDAGSLTLLAGFDSTPGTMGQVRVVGPNTVTGVSTTGGNIDLGNVTINLTSSGANGGSLVAAASAGTASDGTVNLGSVSTTGALGVSGEVQIIGQGGVVVGAIDTNGAAAVDGGVVVRAAQPLVVGTLVYQDGSAISGSISNGALSAGAITVSSIDAGNSSIEIQTLGSATDVLTVGGDLSAHSIDVVSGFGTVDLRAVSGIVANVDGSGNGGHIGVSGNSVLVNTSVDAPFVLNANATTGNGGSVSYFTNDQTATYLGAVPKAKKGSVFFDVSAAGGTGVNAAGGQIDFETGGNLSVLASTTDASVNGTGNANGASYTFKAGSTAPKGGTLAIIGDLDASGIGTGADGSIDLTSNSKKAFTLGSSKAPKNGVQGMLLGDGITVTNDGGGITIASSSAVQAADLSLNAGLKGAIVGSKGVVVTADSIVFNSDAGAIGKKPISVDTDSLEFHTNSKVNLTSVGTSTLMVQTSDAVDGASLTASGSVILNDVIVDDGDISVITGGANSRLSVVSAAHLLATNGGILLQNTQVDTGDIQLGASSIIETAGKGDDVTIAIGALPRKPIAGTQPANVTTDIQGKGEIFWGPDNGIIANGAISNIVAINKAVIFNNGSSDVASKKIILDGGVTVIADPPSRGAATVPVSLLQSPAVVSETVAASEAVQTMGVPPVTAEGYLASQTYQTGQQLKTNQTSQPTNTALLSPLDSFAGAVANSSTVLTTETMNATAGPGTAVGANLRLALGGEEVAQVNAIELISDNLPGAKAHGESHSLKSGRALIVASKDMVVETPDARVSIARGAVVLVVAGGHGTSVYDLHDSKRAGVKVDFGSQSVSLAPGRHATVCARRAGSYSAVNPMESIMHRDVNEVATANGVGAFTSEFSVHSAVQSVSSLRSIFASSHPECAKLSSRMMKTSAILMHLSGSQEPFQQYLAPRVAAYR